MLVPALGCDQDEDEGETPDAHAAADANANANADSAPQNKHAPTRIEKTLSKLDSKAPTEANNGPPPAGIYTTADANAVMAPGASTQVEVAMNGAEPRRVLQPAAPKPGLSREIPASLSWVWQGKAIPPVDFELTFRVVSKPQTAPSEFRAKVGKPQLTGLPAPLRKQFEPLTKQFEGATVTWVQAPNGAATPLVVGDAGGDNGEDAARLLAGMLSDVLVTFPSTPVGQGALWMTTSREVLLGFETITLRMVRLEALLPSSVALSVTTRRYATSDAMPLPGAPTGAKLAQFSATSEAKVTLELDASLPASADVATELQMIMTAPERPNSGVPVRASSKLTLGRQATGG